MSRSRKKHRTITWNESPDRNRGTICIALVIVWICTLHWACTNGDSRVILSDVLTVGIETDPQHLDPRIGTDKMSYNFHRLIYSGLLQRDRRDRLQPDLAEQWWWEDDRTLVFRLRSDVRFHNGRPLRAADVVYTYRSILNGRVITPKRGAFRSIQRVFARDDHTVVFVLRVPDASLLVSLTLGIVPAGWSIERGPPIGTGPYRWRYGQRGREYVLVRYERYHGPRPQTRVLRFRVIPDAMVRLFELEEGSIDLAINNLPIDVLRRRWTHLKFVIAPSSSVTYLAFHLRDPILRDLRVRQAIVHAIPRTAIIRHLFYNTARPARSLLHPTHWAYAPDLPEIPYDPERARALLDAAGWPDPDGDGPHMRFRLTYKTTTRPDRREIAEVIQYALRQIGIDVRIETMEWGTFYYDITHGNFQMYALSWIGVSDPDIYTLVFHSRSVPPHGANRGFYLNPELDRLLDTARRLRDIQQRKRIYHRVQHIIARDLPYVILWYEPNIAGMQNTVQGFRFYPNADFYALVFVRKSGKAPREKATTEKSHGRKVTWSHRDRLCSFRYCIRPFTSLCFRHPSPVFFSLRTARHR